MRITTFCLVALFGGNLASQEDRLRTGDGSLQYSCPSWRKFGEYAWLYGYAPLWVYKKHHDQTQKTTGETVLAPENCLYVSETLDNTDSQLFVSPNPNVLYASAHLNLTTTSVRLFVKPNPNNQHYIWQTMDAFTNSVPDWYISSTNAPNHTLPLEGNFAFVYTGCKGVNCSCSVPSDEDINIIYTDMPNIWMVVRYYVKHDQLVNETRDALLASTLGVTNGYNASKGNPSHYNDSGPYNPGMPIDTDEIGALDLLNKWISYNGYGPIDQDNKTLFQLCGLEPNSNMNFTQQLGPSAKRLLLIGIKSAKAEIKLGQVTKTKKCNEWGRVDPTYMGNYGTNFLVRSTVAYLGLGANIPTMGMYDAAEYNEVGRLNANSTYSITLPQYWVDEPPYNNPGYWSLTVYNLSTGSLLNTTDNIVNVHYPSDNIVKNNGEVVIWLSAEKPDTSKVNWLPFPEYNSHSIFLIFRIYGTKRYVEKMCYEPRHVKLFNKIGPVTRNYNLPHIVTEH